jgi:glucokinase
LLPLLLFSEKDADTFLVAGISPLTYSTVNELALDDRETESLRRLSNFKQLFALAAKDLGVEYSPQGKVYIYIIYLYVEHLSKSFIRLSICRLM